MIYKGQLTVIKIKGKTYTIKCSCGNIFSSYKSRFDGYSGKGCNKCKSVGKNNGRYKHGGNMDSKPTYSSYHAMRNRCYKPSFWAYHRYGGRGIKVCDRWLGKDGYANFVHDVGYRPTAKHSIDRIDSDKDYYPENCKWSTQIEQTNNVSTNVVININGKTNTLAEWCRIYNQRYGLVHLRHRKGWDWERALQTKTLGRGSNQSTYK